MVQGGMELTAKDVMQTRYHVLAPDMPLSEAISLFRRASLDESRRVFGMPVVDQGGRLAGMLSMYDILLYVRPKHIRVWGEMEEVLPEGLFDATLERLRSLWVEDLMTPDVLTVEPDVHILRIIDIMIKKHVRRIPVVQEERILGVVYISDVFYHLLQRFI
jgi:CBS domain-containing protein